MGGNEEVLRLQRIIKYCKKEIKIHMDEIKFLEKDLSETEEKLAEIMKGKNKNICGGNK